MKIAITSTGTDLNSDVDPRFGRAAYFIVYDTESGNFETIDNSENASAGSGVGIKSGQLMIDKGVEWVITGSVGPNAFQVLSSAGIKVASGASGKVSEAIEAFKSGKFSETNSPTAQSHHGLQQ